MFVEIGIEVDHLVKTIAFNIENKGRLINLMGIIQFNTTLLKAKQMLEK